MKALYDTVLYAEGKSWKILSQVKANDVFLVHGGAQDFEGWKMLRVVDGGSLQADFVIQVDMVFDIVCYELDRKKSACEEAVCLKENNNLCEEVVLSTQKEH